jgi:hypothetical protein
MYVGYVSCSFRACRFAACYVPHRNKERKERDGNEEIRKTISQR